MKSVSIVIPNWNGLELLTEYFCSVVGAAERYHAEEHAEVEVIVVDDASADSSREWLSEHERNNIINLVELQNNVGFVRAVNRGFQAATNDVVFLLNNDVRVEPDCIFPLVKHFDEPNVFAVCCRADRIKTGRLDGGGKLGTFKRGFWRVFVNYEAIPSETGTDLISFFGSGGYTAYDRQKLMILGGFQDCLAPNYWEDVEICYRAWKRGWTVRYEPTSLVHHLGSASMKKQPSNEMSIVTELNRLLMTWINLHERIWFAKHLGWLGLKLVGSVVSLRWNYLRSFRRALSKISKVRAARRIERKAAAVSDRELAQKFAELIHKPGIYMVADEQAEAAFAEMSRKTTASAQVKR